MNQTLNPYNILGISPNASDKQIQKAYRLKAKVSHPDVKNKKNIDKFDFTKINSAYKFLSNKKNRKMFDDGIINFEGQRLKVKNKSSKKFEQKTNEKSQKKKKDITDDLFFKKIINQKRIKIKQYKKSFNKFYSKIILNKSNNNINYSFSKSEANLFISLKTAIRGGLQKLILDDKSTVIVNIPPGIKSGQIMRLRGQGEIGISRSRKDLFVKIHVKSEPHLSLIGDDIHLNLSISLSEAVLGSQIKIPTLDGIVEIKVPKASNSGDILRLKGKGVKRVNGQKPGDQLVNISIQLPKENDIELQNFINQWTNRKYNPRKLFTN